MPCPVPANEIYVLAFLSAPAMPIATRIESWVAGADPQSLKRAYVRYMVFAAIVSILVPLPVADELMAAPQFRRLCEEGTKLKFDPEKVKGKTIFLAKTAQTLRLRQRRPRWGHVAIV